MDNATDGERLNAAWLASMMRGEGMADAPPFKPAARYYPEMDHMLFLREDCSYRAERVGPFLDLLWHPDEDRVVGIKLWIFRFLAGQARRIHGLQPTDPIPVATALEISLAGGVAEGILKGANLARIMQLYEEARQAIASDTALLATELPPTTA
jgi:hypothetical protein